MIGNYQLIKRAVCYFHVVFGNFWPNHMHRRKNYYMGDQKSMDLLWRKWLIKFNWLPLFLVNIFFCGRHIECLHFKFLGVSAKLDSHKIKNSITVIVVANFQRVIILLFLNRIWVTYPGMPNIHLPGNLMHYSIINLKES